MAYTVMPGRGGTFVLVDERGYIVATYATRAEAERERDIRSD